MVEKNQKPKSEFDAKKAFNYMHGAQAINYVESHDAEGAMGAIAALAEKEGASEFAKNLLNVASANYQNTKLAASLYQKDFNDMMEKATKNDLNKFYSTVLKDAEKDLKKNINATFDVLGNKTLGQIQKELVQAEYRLSGNEKFSEEEIKKALETQSKYENFLKINQTLLHNKVNETLADSVEATRKRSLEGLALSFKKN